MRIPGNAFNNLLGHALGGLAARGGARRLVFEGGRVVLYSGCGGPVGAFIKGINGGREAALALGRVVLSTRALDLSTVSDRWLIAHERVHVAQAEKLGVLYLPAYLLGTVPATVRWLLRRARGGRTRWHDLHPMEEHANRVANAAEPRGVRVL